MSPPFLSDPSSLLLPGTSQSSEAMARTESSSSASSSSSTVWNYLWIPLLISFSKELSLAKAAHHHHSSASNPILFPSTADAPPMPSCPNPDPKLNFRPVIGILSHPGDGASGRLDDSPNASYIAASYVKFVESAGARVIPLIYNEPARVLEKKLNMVNGVLFTGGWAKDGSYFETVEKIFKYVLAKNDAGEHFPLYAICLGFELLTMIISKNNNILEEFDATDQASTLDFIRNTHIEGTVFQRFPPDLLRKLSTDCLVMQNHHYGISLERLQETSDLRSFFKVLTTSTDRDNKAYVSTVQANHYPVSAFQWHPEHVLKSMLKNASRAMTAMKSEVHTARYISGQWPVVVDYTLKNAFEWGPSMIPHSDEAIQVTQHVANFFVSEARKSPNRPSSRKVLDNLIYNYSPTYCGKAGRGYDEVYIFTKPSPISSM